MTSGGSLQPFRIRPLHRAPSVDDLYVTATGYFTDSRRQMGQEVDAYTIALIVDGHGFFRVHGGGEYAVATGSIFVCDPKGRFDFGPEPGTSWTRYYLGMAGDGVDRLIRYGWIPGSSGVYPLGNTARLIERFQELFGILHHATPRERDWAVLTAQAILLEIHYARTDIRHPPEPNPALKKALGICRRDVAKEIDFQALAKEIGVSYSHLRQQFRKITGDPPARFLAKLRCEIAASFLAETDLGVKTIGERVGIPDPYDFSRTFKRHVGCSPTHFRKGELSYLMKRQLPPP